MATKNNEIEPIACDLTVFSKLERAEHMEDSKRIFEKCEGFGDAEYGLDIFFEKSISENKMKKWVEAEGRCCKFLEFNLLRETDRWVLAIKTTEKGKGFFLQAITPLMLANQKDLPPLGTKLAKSALGLAAILCLSCFLPIIGGVFVAKGVFPTSWNLGEIFWIGFGLTLIGLSTLISKMKKRSKQQDSAACGC